MQTANNVNNTSAAPEGLRSEFRTPNSALAIVGIGCLFPKAAGPGFFWANVKSGADGITEVPPTHWNPDDYFHADPKKPDMTYARRGGFLSAVEFNPLEFGIAPRDIEATDTTQLLGLVAAKQALTDARVTFKGAKDATATAVDRNRVSVILGVTGTLELVIPLGARLGHPKWKRAMADAGIPADLADDAAERIAESYVPWQENSFPGLLGNVVAGRIANKLDLGGTNCVVDAACASSLSAVHLAALELQAGRSDVVVTGGCDTFNDIFMYMCFSKTPALSPTGDAKPFDADGDGTILGEGLGMVVLKRLADAERDGDTVYAVLKGVGSSSDGKGKAIYEPSAAGQKKALLAAYGYAGITPDTIELVEAHGTGTKVGDTVEITALTDVYTNTGGGSAKPRPWAAVGSVKSQIGHTKAAAGAASLIKAALAVYNKVLPPTVKVKLPVEPLRGADSPFYVNAEMRPWLPRAEHPRRAALSAFGFGGSNFHAVLEEHKANKLEPDWDGSVEVVALGAPTPKELAAAVAKLPTEWPAFAVAAEASRASFSPSAACRLCFAAHQTLTDLPKLLAGAKARLAAEPDASGWHTPDGVHFGRGSAGKLAVLFPGQGSQYVGMGRELACLFPEALDALALANDAVRELAQDDTDTRRLSDRVYPPTTFGIERKNEHERDLRDTRNAQPAIGAVSFAAWRVLTERFGLKADCFAGHSYGELVALCAAGRLQPRDLFTLSRVRGQLMAGARPGDPGAMLAAFAAPSEIEAVISREKLNVVVANRNAPKQTVLSGPTPQVERAARLLSDAGIKATQLPVAAAFHSALVADAAPPFRAALEGVALAAGAAPVYANTTAEAYPADERAAKDLLANQLARPVAFVEQVRAMAAAGVRTFVEVGPGAVLTRLAEAIAADAPIQAESFALDASGGKRSGVLDLGNALARLAAGGHAVAVGEWERGSRCRPQPSTGKPGLTVPVCGANSVQPRAPRPPRPPQQLASANGNGKLALPARPKGSAMSESSGAPGPADPNALAQALAMTQQSLAALQRMQEQTAALHKQFLDTQEAAGRTLNSLVEQQQTLLFGTLGTGVALPPAPPTPAPRPVAPVPAPYVAPVPVPPPYVPPAPRPAAPPLTTVLPASALPAEAFAPPKSAPPAPARPAPRDGVAAALLSVVSEKTGYPADSLDLSLSLDADLGVDSIKRVEILSALQEKLPDAPVVKPEHLGTLHTLKDVADFLAGGAAPATTKIPMLDVSLTMPTKPITPQMEIEPATVEPPVPDTVQLSGKQPPKLPDADRPGARAHLEGTLRQPVAPFGTDRIDRSILQVVDLDIAAPRSRLPLPSGAEFWVVAEPGPLTDTVAKELKGRGLAPRVLGWTAASGTKPNAGPLAGVVLLAPIAPPPDLNRRAFDWLKLAAGKLRQGGRTAASVFATVCRLDGAFGLADLSPDADPTAGGLAGLAKTARLEWPEVNCKALDLSPAFTDFGAAAAALADEMLSAGASEIGISPTHRCTLELARTARRPNAQLINLGARDVVVVTGGARGVTAEIAVALAETYNATLVLTGRTPPPAPEPEYLAGVTGELEMKKAIADALGHEASPRTVGDLYKKVTAQREVRSTLERIGQAGAKAAYFPVDITDDKAVADLLHQVRVKFGPVTALVHGAGVLADRRIEDLTAEQFDHVYTTKVDGLRAILDLLGHDELKALVLFSSTTARLGRIGQLAYACANEVLNKTAQVEARRRPSTRVVSVNWGPWDGGMVTPGLRKMFEAEGVGVIPLLDGAMFLIQELNAAGRAVEVVALAKPPARPAGGSGSGVMPKVGSGVTPAPAERAPAAPVISPPNPLPSADMLPAFERAVDVTTHPVLKSHVLDGLAVLPVALHLEWLAHAAMHGNPGLQFHGFNDLRVTNGVKIEAGSQVPIRALAGKATKQDKLFVVPVELRGKRKDGRELLFSRAEIVLAPALPKPPVADAAPAVAPVSYTVERAYQEFLFHGADLQGIAEIAGRSARAFVGTAYPAPPPADWFEFPLRSGWVADPLALDAAFQMMILWTQGEHNTGSLPSFIGRYRQFRKTYPADPITVVVRVTRDDAKFARADIDFLAPDGTVVAQMQNYECVMEPTLNASFRKNQLLSSH